MLRGSSAERELLGGPSEARVIALATDSHERRRFCGLSKGLWPSSFLAGGRSMAKEIYSVMDCV